MGGTIILWQALSEGEIALYPEYTGTIAEEILKTKKPMSTDEMGALLRQRGVGMTEELGFNNAYALVMQRNRAVKLGYAALANGSIDLKDAYSTDARITENDLAVLDDDLHFFPQYKAVFLYRLDMDVRAVAALQKLAHTLDLSRMARLNSEAERTKDYALAASLYFDRKPVASSKDFIRKIAGLTLRHLEMVAASLLLGIIAGVPLGILASRPMWSEDIYDFRLATQLRNMAQEVWFTRRKTSRIFLRISEMKKPW